MALCNNKTSIFGIMLFTVSLTLVFVYTLASWMGITVNQYLEGLIFMTVPVTFVGGMIFVPLGIFMMHRRELLLGRSPSHFEIKVKDPRFKGSMAIFIAITFTIVFPVLSVSGYKLYNFTESTVFCGQICHVVMEPQAVAHARSAHARVRCAECHIGAGADFFVKSKLSGMRQVYAVIADTYPRPIPPAITELRPARDTCEECHWPSKFFGTQYKKKVHFSANEFNTRREFDILIKTGGGNASTGRAEGIHMYMLASGPIEYKSADENLQEIPWVKYTRTNGDASVYTKSEDVEKVNSKETVTRHLDCMDCHNRGAHHLASPKAAMDSALELKQIDASLPFIMREAINVLAPTYPTVEDAHKKIEAGIVGFYRDKYPDISVGKKNAIMIAVQRIQKIYDENFFPEMKENWKTYPENVGHQFSPGCFRCHDGLHVDEKGRAISSDCTSCHLFINSSDEGMDCLSLGKFQHPNSLSVHRRVLCSSCHGAGKYRTCEDCHKNEEWKKLRGTGQFLLPEDRHSNRMREDIDDATLKDALFRLDDSSHKTEWELTEPLRQIEIKRNDADIAKHEDGDPGAQP
jgi:nitrate/TMAO reductase-like tetraheme cytochrome c subunit